MPVGKEASRLLNITVSGATGTGTLTNEWSIARWIRVIPVAEVDTYDVTIKDADGDIILKYTGQVGTMSSNLEISLGIAKTILIENASGDGTFKVKWDLH